MPSLVPAPSLLWGRGCICVRHCAGPGNTLSDFEKRLTVADFGGGRGGTPLVTGGFCEACSTDLPKGRTTRIFLGLLGCCG